MEAFTTVIKINLIEQILSRLIRGGRGSIHGFLGQVFSLGQLKLIW